MEKLTENGGAFIVNVAILGFINGFIFYKKKKYCKLQINICE